MHHSHCKECGKPLTSTRKPKSFCDPDHRLAWVNRRAERGSLIYDLFMATRYDRKAAAELDLWTKLCRMGEIFREEDLKAKRPQTWRKPREVMQDRADLSSRHLLK